MADELAEIRARDAGPHESVSQAAVDRRTLLRLLDEAHAKLAALDWQPMETAPQGRQILALYVSEYSASIDLVRWNDDRHSMRPRPYWDRGGFRISASRDLAPTAWKLPPEIPADLAANIASKLSGGSQ